MIGINFNSDNEAQLIHYQPENVDTTFDLTVDNLPAKDDSKSDMKAILMRDSNNELYWDYRKKPASEEERITDLENAMANILGGSS